MANEFKVKKGLIAQGSGSTILDVQGSQGQLFSVTDNLSGSLFSVNDISGIPVLEVFSDDTINMGTFGAEAIKIAGSFATMTGSLFGTSSWADNATTASYALTASSTTAIAGTTNYVPKFTASETLGNSQIYDDGTNVGIGTTSPSAKLQIQDTTPILRIQSNTVNNDSALQLMETSIIGAEIRYNGSSTNNLQFNINDGTGFITKMQLNRDSGILNVPASITIGENPQTFSKLSIKLDGDGQGILIDRGTNSGTNSWNGLFFKSSNTVSQPKSAIVHERLGSWGVGTLHFLTNNSETSNIGVDLSDARMSITKDGDVGIGTTNPTSKLEVDGNISATTYNNYIPLPTEALTTTGTVVTFLTDSVYGTLVTPETGNISSDITDAKLGVTNIIIHNSSTEPTFSSEFKKLRGSSSYLVDNINYIYCTYIADTEIIYSINQRT